MKKTLLVDISASTLQILVNQIAGLMVFYLLSKYLSKELFGEINWLMAIFIISFNILGFGIDQIVVRRIAAGAPPSSVLSLHLIHVLATSVVLFTALALCNLFFHGFFVQHDLLLWLAISQCLLFLSSPFKQIANGKEQFRRLMVMSIVSSVVRLSSVLTLAAMQQITVKLIILIFLGSTACEFIICAVIVYGVIKIPFSVKWSKASYFSLVKDSLPQLGTVVLNAGILRFDWIILGFLTSQVIVANYSFAYRVFEIAALPLFILAPLVIPRFTRYFSKSSSEYDKQQKLNDLLVFLRLSIILACLTSLVINLVWVDFIDRITDNKYGVVNKNSILILSTALPFVYLNNFLWTIHFVSNRLTRILSITLVTFVINAVGDVCLIPFLKGEGAAVAILIAFIVQSILYSQKANVPGLAKIWQTILFCSVSAVLCGWLGKYGFENVNLSLLSALVVYSIVLIVGNQIRSIDWLVLKRVLK